jgi:branched-chain amino acid transport system permease protein
VSFVVILPYFLESLENYFDIIHGLILVLILMFLPQGFVTGIWDQVRIFLARRRLAREAARRV